MNAQHRGILAAYKGNFNKNCKKSNKSYIYCEKEIHTEIGVCEICKVEFVKWVCYDKNNKILNEIILPKNR